jgi:hypothetical protein
MGPRSSATPVPRSQRNDNFIDKSFTVMADLILKVLPTNQRAKEAFAYYRDGMSAQADGEYAEALDNYAEAGGRPQRPRLHPLQHGAGVRQQR